MVSGTHKSDVCLRILAALICFVACQSLAALGHAKTLVDLSITSPNASGQSDTWVNFRFDQTTSFRVFTLDEPYRLVVDVPSLAGPKRMPFKPSGLVSALRIGDFDDKTRRHVFELNAPVVIDPPVLAREQSGFTLTVRMEKRSKKEFAAQAYDDEGRTFANRSSAKVAQWARRARLGKGTATDAGSEFTFKQSATGNDIYAPFMPKPIEKPWLRGSSHKPVIILDPGHGGQDPGAVSRHGIREKDVTLAFAAELGARLIATGRYQVYLTRNTDIYIPLRQRTQLAKRVSGDLFLSIHADSYKKNRAIRGASVYTLSETASDAEAEALALRENKSSIINGLDLNRQNDGVSGILIDLAQRETMNFSSVFAKDLVASIRKSWPMRENPHRFAGFAVLKAPDMPSALLEMGYLTNDVDEAVLVRADYRAVLATSVISSLDTYFGRSDVRNARR